MPKPFVFPIHFMVFLCSALLLLLPGDLLGQTAPIITSNPSAVSLAGQALQSLAGGTALTDITIQASASYVAGSDEEAGSATLIARGNAQSLITLNLSGGQRQEIRNGIAGAWTGPDGTARALATHNCIIDADWFFPALSLSALASDPTEVITLVGQQVFEGQQVYHLILLHNSIGQSPGAAWLVQRVSAMDLYLDATTLRPVALDFNIHPDNDAGVNIPAEILFGAYQQFQGVWAPTRIQKYLQNTLLLDLTVSSVAVNSGISASAFMLPAVAEGGGQ
jgi:hypothetical protein